MGKILSENQNITAAEGEKAHLPCTVDDPDETSIQWTKENGKESIRLFSSTLRQTPDLRYQMNPHNYTLSISNVNKNDSGTFVCDDGETTVVHQLIVTPKGQTPYDWRHSLLDVTRKEAIRNHIYDYYLRGEPPIMKKLRESLHDSGLIESNNVCLQPILQQIGFKFTKIGSRALAVEREDIVLWRCSFLRYMLRPNLNFDDVVWLDETTFHTEEIDGTRDGLMCPEPTLSVKGESLIIIHAGTAGGFVSDAFELISYHNTTEYELKRRYREDFKRWFQRKLLDNLEGNRVIVMDSSVFHSELIDPAPTFQDQKTDIIDWLSKHNVPFDPQLRKPELVQLVKQHKRPPQFEIDEIARQKGHRVIRLPPYHSHFHPLEMIWRFIKHYVAAESQQYTMMETKKLIFKGIKKVTAKQWRRNVAHVKDIFQNTWHRDGLVEDAMENLYSSVYLS